MVLGFKKQLVEPIMAGTKIHTIREDKGDRWHKGMKIHMATGVRTKAYECFKEAECTGVQKVFMWLALMESELNVSVDGRLLSEQETLELAVADGFRNMADFKNWFLPLLRREEDILFYQCFLIHWTDKRY